MRRTIPFVSVGALLLLAACSPPVVSTGDGGGNDAADTGADALPSICALDTDRDSIPDSVEGEGDADRDGTPNKADEDSDNDRIPDAIEAHYGSERPSCVTRPMDSDADNTPDYLDRDSNGDGLEDITSFAPPVMQEPPEGGWERNPFDLDGDRIPDYADRDADGDGIENSAEITVNGMPEAPDTDSDGRPDWRDVDSDNDTIGDRDEGTTDRDRDMLGNFRDLDSDGDGATDRDESGDADISTPPLECAREVDARDPAMVRPDGLPDFLDFDSDNDGAGDREERAAGTSICNGDTDADGQLDVVENAYCGRRMMMGCGTDPMRRIPATDYFVILPLGTTATRELEFGTNIRVADVFFIADTTGSMTTVLRAVRESIATPVTGIADRIRAQIPETWFGVGHYEDYPLSAHAASSDRVFHPLCPGLPGTSPVRHCQMSTYGGIQINRDAMAVQTAAVAIPGGSGGDGLSTSVEAMYQLLVGDGYYDRSSGTPCENGTGANRCWVPPTTCPEGRFGAACFRSGSLPIIVHYSDTQSHYGSRNPGATNFNREPTDVMPRGHTTDDLLTAMRRVGARMISLNAQTGTRCEGRVDTMHVGTQPCYDFRMWAEGSGSVNVDGNPFIFDISTTNTAPFIEGTVEGVRQIASRTPIDISTQLENDPANPAMVNATEFITRRVPSCEIEPRNRNCFTPASGVSAAQAVGRTDSSTFFRVLPGTRVRFTIVFANNDVFPGYEDRSTLFHAYIHVVGDGFARLDTREVFILVPARSSDPG